MDNDDDSGSSSDTLLNETVADEGEYEQKVSTIMPI